MLGISKDYSSLIPTCRRVIKLYTLCFSSKFDGVDIPDYLDRVKKIENLETATELEIGQWLVTQSQLGDERSQVINIIKDSLKREVFAYNMVFNKVEKTYLALGGKLGEYDDNIIKLSGDFYQTFNGITLARECGITELI